MRGMTSVVLGTVLITLFSIQSDAEIYKWVDENGKVHFTDNPANIPKSSNVETRKEFRTPSPKKVQSDSSGVRSPASTLKGEEPQRENFPSNKSQTKQEKKGSILLGRSRKQSRNISPPATVSAMLRAAIAGNWEKYVDEFYGEQHKFKSSSDRDSLISRFRDKWGNKVISGLKEVSKVKPRLSGDKAIFPLKKGEFILYKNEQGNWMFHL